MYGECRFDGLWFLAAASRRLSCRILRQLAGGSAEIRGSVRIVEFEFGAKDHATMTAVTDQSSPVALVVGATGGIGRAVAHALADRYTVGLAGRNEESIQELADSLPNAFCWPIDFSDVGVISAPPPQLSRLSLLVHCAGYFALGGIGDTRIEAWKDVFDVNLFGVVDLTQRVLPALRATRGRVIVVNSTAISGSPANRSAYVASKAALRSFTNALHQEELDNGIRVTTVYCGRVDTDMQREVRAAEEGPYEADRYLSPASVAAAILWVVSAPADTHITEFEVKPTWC
jgi:NADP-dependent 3-hydroxy acid dehydrogenase YdfG